MVFAVLLSFLGCVAPHNPPQTPLNKAQQRAHSTVLSDAISPELEALASDYQALTSDGISDNEVEVVGARSKTGQLRRLRESAAQFSDDPMLADQAQFIHAAGMLYMARWGLSHARPHRVASSANEDRFNEILGPRFRRMAAEAAIEFRAISDENDALGRSAVYVVETLAAVD